MLGVLFSQTSLFCLSLFIVSSLFFFFAYYSQFCSKNDEKTNKQSKRFNNNNLPRSYPLAGHLFAILKNRLRILPWTTEILQHAPSATFVLRFPLGKLRIMTADPKNVQHLLKTRFQLYPKTQNFQLCLRDLFGGGIFLAHGEEWKRHRQLLSPEFHSRSFQSYIETVTQAELNDRLVPLFAAAARNKTVLDLQDIIRRFTFDVVAKEGLGYDLEYLLPTFPPTPFADAYGTAGEVCIKRCLASYKMTWKAKRFFNIGSEKKLKLALSELKGLIRKAINEKKELGDDLLSRLLSRGFKDEIFLLDSCINFLLAGQDTMASALTWFFYNVSKNPNAVEGILKEVKEKDEDTLVDMPYTHAALSESMRLYPPAPLDGKGSTEDDVWPDGTKVKKGTGLVYHIYAMGRMPDVWGQDWADFRPERWLKRDDNGSGWTFVPRDAFTYPVFQAGPRMCLGKDIAFMQMKMIVSAVLRRFIVTPAMGEGYEAEPETHLSIKIRGGFPVRIVERCVIE